MYPTTWAAWDVLWFSDSPTTSRSPVSTSGSTAERAAWAGGLARATRKSSPIISGTGMPSMATSAINTIRIRSQVTITPR